MNWNELNWIRVLSACFPMGTFTAHELPVCKLNFARCVPQNSGLGLGLAGQVLALALADAVNYGTVTAAQWLFTTMNEVASTWELHKCWFIRCALSGTGSAAATCGCGLGFGVRGLGLEGRGLGLDTCSLVALLTSLVWTCESSGADGVVWCGVWPVHVDDAYTTSNTSHVPCVVTWCGVWPVHVEDAYTTFNT